MCDCTAIPFNSFKEKIRVQKELEREMIAKFGKKAKQYYKLITLENCVMAQYSSKNLYH